MVDGTPEVMNLVVHKRYGYDPRIFHTKYLEDDGSIYGVDFLKKKEDSFTQGSDLSENAEYIFATEEMYKIEKKINEIEQEIMKSKIIDYSTFPSDSVKFGLTVTLVSDEQEDRMFQIVGSSETDIENNKLSVESPLGISLLGKVVGDEVYIGDHLYEISKIENI